MKIFIIVGTRPEYIKLAPVYLEFQNLNKLAENEDAENAEIRVQQQSSKGTVAERTRSRLRRTNDRSALGVHEDHEDDENAEIGVREHALNKLSTQCPRISPSNPHISKSTNIFIMQSWITLYVHSLIIKNSAS